MANDAVGRISVDITGNEKPLLHKIEGLGGQLKAPLTKLGAAIAAAFSAAMLKKFAEDCIETAAKVNAANAQMAQTFGALEAQAKSAMHQVAKESGIMETRLQEVGTAIYAFAKTGGMDSVTALNMMQEALQVTADSAAYYDRSLEDTAASLKSFLKGNYANDAALGLSCTETTRNTAANKLYGKSFRDLSEAQKQLVLLQMVKDANRLSGALGQAARESEGWENVTGNLKEAWRQLKAVIGQPMLKFATAVVKRLTAAIQELTVYTQSAITHLAALFHWDLSQPEALSALSEGAADGAESMDAAAEAAKKLKKATAGFDQLNILSSSESDIDAAGASSASGALPTAALSETDNAVSRIESKIAALKDLLQQLLRETGLNRALTSFQQQVESVSFQKIADNFHSVFNDLQPIAQAAFAGMRKVSESELNYLGTLLGGLIRTTGNGLQTISGGVAEWLQEDKDRISDTITDITDNLSSAIDSCTELIGTLFDVVNDSMERMRPGMEGAVTSLLSGMTTLTGAIGETLSGAFAIAAEKADQWAKDNSDALGTALDSVQDTARKITSGFGRALEGIGEDISSWWSGSGVQQTFSELCDLLGDVGSAALTLYAQAIKPATDNIIGKLSAMRQSVRPVFQNLLKLLKSVGDAVTLLWKEQIKPVVDWVVQNIGPAVSGVVDIVLGTVQGVYTAITGVISGVLQSLSGLIDFITGVFSGDWEKAWNGIGEIFRGMWNSLTGVFSGFCSALVNLLGGLLKIIVGVLQMIWAAILLALSTVWKRVSGVLSSIGALFSQVWDGIRDAWDGAVRFFEKIWKGIKNAFSTAKEWLVSQFTGAWESIVGLFSKGGEVFSGIQSAMGDIFKSAVNDLIDGINTVISEPLESLNSILSSIKNTEIPVIKQKPFSGINTIPVPQIPKLAKGGLVKAPTLAMVGDNKGAAHDPEVVSPLSKLQGMIGSGDPEVVRLLGRIVALMEREETVYQNNVYLDGEIIESRLVRVRKRRQRRYG